MMNLNHIMKALRDINKRLDVLEGKAEGRIPLGTAFMKRYDSSRMTYTREMDEFLTEEYCKKRVWRKIAADFNTLFETNKAAATLRAHLLYIHGIRY